MNQELFADLWGMIADNVAENKKSDLAHTYINLLTDYDVPASTIEGMMGIDSYLDAAIEYSIDDANFDAGSYEDYDEDDVYDDED